MRYLFRVCSQGSRLLPDPSSLPNERLCDPPRLPVPPQVSLCDPCPHPTLPFLTFLYSSGPSDLGAAQAPLWRRQWHPTPVLLPGKSHGQSSLVGCSPWGLEDSDTTERLHFHFSLSCIGERNGNPLQCSCLENPRDRGAW